MKGIAMSSVIVVIGPDVEFITGSNERPTAIRFGDERKVD